MNPIRKQKLMIVLFIVLGSGVTTGLLLYAFDQGLNVFFTPTEITEGKVAQNQYFRIGGMVKAGSLDDEHEGTLISFITTDFNKDIPVLFDGVLPDLFREGQGVVAEGYMDADGVFHAEKIFAKHDENYMSAEVKAAIEAGERNKAVEMAADSAAN